MTDSSEQQFATCLARRKHLPDQRTTRCELPKGHRGQHEAASVEQTTWFDDDGCAMWDEDGDWL